jgi:hypothetical protein
MSDPDRILAEYVRDYSEYGEMLGAMYPQFLLHKMAADLAKARDRIETLEKVNNVIARR